VRQSEINIEPLAREDDLGFGHIDDRGVNAIRASALYRRSSREVRGSLKGCDELGPAIRIATIVCRINTYENIKSPEYLSPCKSKTQQYRIARRHIRWRNSTLPAQIGPIFGHFNRRIG
jgi:hypothetical protein